MTFGAAADVFVESVGGRLIRVRARVRTPPTPLTMAPLTMALLTMAPLTMALLTMALLTMALLTMARLTMAPYLPTYLLLTHLPAYLPICLPTYLPTYLPTGVQVRHPPPTLSLTPNPNPNPNPNQVYKFGLLLRPVLGPVDLAWVGTTLAIGFGCKFADYQASHCLLLLSVGIVAPRCRDISLYFNPDPNPNPNPDPNPNPNPLTLTLPLTPKQAMQSRSLSMY